MKISPNKCTDTKCQTTHFHITPEQPTDWQKDFYDFYMEQGKWHDRELGYKQYVNYVQNLLLSQHDQLKTRYMTAIGYNVEDPEVIDRIINAVEALTKKE